MILVDYKEMLLKVCPMAREGTLTLSGENIIFMPDLNKAPHTLKGYPTIILGRSQEGAFWAWKDAYFNFFKRLAKDD